MMTHAIASFDSHHTIYNNRTYVHTKYSSIKNQSFHPYSTTLPIPSIKICEKLLYERKIAEDISSNVSSSYFNSSEHYDNSYLHTYDNPIDYLGHVSCNTKQSLINLPYDNENLYDNARGEEVVIDEKNCSSSISHSKSPILFYLENKRLVFYACMISLFLLFIIGIGIFLLNKFIRPVVINTTVNNHYDITNMSNTSTTSIISQLTIPSTPAMLLMQPLTGIPVTTNAVTIDNLPFRYSPCPPNLWGIQCNNICKPCGLGVCHSITGKCICPADIYGEFCDLWKVNDQPKRGDMTRR